MKTLDLYTIRLIRDNALYLVLLVVFVLIIAIFIPFQIKYYLDQEAKIAVLQKEPRDLDDKNTILLSYKQSDVDELITELNTLIPSEEDFFSMFSALESLSKKSGFTISGYKANLKHSKKGQFTLTIEGSGSVDSYLRFLTAYPIAGGRLITIEKANAILDNAKNSLTLTFYSHKPSLKQSDALTKIDNLVLTEARKAAQLLPEEIDDTQQQIASSSAIRVNPFGE